MANTPTLSPKSPIIFIDEASPENPLKGRLPVTPDADKDFDYFVKLDFPDQD